MFVHSASSTATVRVWADQIEDKTLRQAERTARSPAVSAPVALMPDAHWGMGATIGSVIPTKSAIIPAAVGVDIGCGMIAAKTRLDAADLPDDLGGLLSDIERGIPAGLGKWNREAGKQANDWMRGHPFPGEVNKPGRAAVQLGTLGSGNHFVEICLDENDAVWVMLHSGSRGIGNQLAMGHIRVAKQLEGEHEDPDLAFLLAETPEFDAYIRDMLWAQDYAMFNRVLMVDEAIRALAHATVGLGGLERGKKHPIEIDRVNCHHNYASKETHNINGQDEEVWITRKGAIYVGAGQRGVIPGSMGQKSYVVRGNASDSGALADSYFSASHGAGRVLGRKAAKRQLGADAWDKMEGVTWQSAQADALLDEAPGAYKNIDDVMEAQKDLVQVDHTLRAVLNYKGL